MNQLPCCFSRLLIIAAFRFRHFYAKGCLIISFFFNIPNQITIKHTSDYGLPFTWLLAVIFLEVQLQPTNKTKTKKVKEGQKQTLHIRRRIIASGKCQVDKEKVELEYQEQSSPMTLEKGVDVKMKEKESSSLISVLLTAIYIDRWLL